MAPTYQLTLHKTYYERGFFNLGVEVERFVRKDSGPVTLKLGVAGREIEATVNRTCNTNGTPRVLGGPELRNWFQKNFDLKDVVTVEILEPSKMAIKGASR